MAEVIAPLASPCGSGHLLCPQAAPVQTTLSGPEQSQKRLSLRHGATTEALEVYMQALSQRLRFALYLGRAATWTRDTPRLEQHYLLEKELGRGHFGVVRCCKERATGQKFACKSILKASIARREDVDELCSEVQCMLRAQAGGAHPHIVQLHEVLEDEEAVHLVMEHCAGGDLFDYIVKRRRLSEKEAAHIVKQIISALQALHSVGLVHRDLKPENVLLAEPSYGSSLPTVKVADFGLCVALRKEQRVMGIAGSPMYMAPEVVRGDTYNHTVDLWSLGVILYTCLAGAVPFWAKNTKDMFLVVVKAEPDMNKKGLRCVSADAKALIRRLLDPQASQRISAEGVLSHCWMRQHCPELRQSKPIDIVKQEDQGRRCQRASTQDWQHVGASGFLSSPWHLQSQNWLHRTASHTE